VGIKGAVTRADPLSVGKNGKEERFLGPATVVKPALFGAGVLFFIQTAMRVFLKA
jgi:hypothetical protein